MQAAVLNERVHAAIVGDCLALELADAWVTRYQKGANKTVPKS